MPNALIEDLHVVGDLLSRIGEPFFPIGNVVVYILSRNQVREHDIHAKGIVHEQPLALLRDLKKSILRKHGSGQNNVQRSIPPTSDHEGFIGINNRFRNVRTGTAHFLPGYAIVKIGMIIIGGSILLTGRLEQVDVIGDR